MFTPASFGADLVQPFQLESSPLRGRLIRLGPTLDLILHQHDYPAAIGKILGEAMVIAAALGTSLKYEGVFTLQVKSDGVIRMLVADVTSNGGIRAYAQYGGVESLTPEAGLLGKGYLAFTVDQQLKDDRYQGIVELTGNNLSEAVQHYFLQSEQLATGIMASVHYEHGRWRGGGLMLQRMPREGGVANENLPPLDDALASEEWNRALMLMRTCSQEELVDGNLAPQDLLYRLFHEEGVHLYEPHPFRHQCRCSEERVTSVLRALPQNEIEAMAIQGMVEVTCEFCNKIYSFDPEQRAQLYKERSSDSDHNA